MVISIRIGRARSRSDQIADAQSSYSLVHSTVCRPLLQCRQKHMTHTDDTGHPDANSPHRPHAKSIAVLALILLWSAFATASRTAAATITVEVLTGRLVARAVGPPLTSFGENHEYYIFELASPHGQRFVILSYKFLLYQDVLLEHGFDYLHVYTFKGERDLRCENTLEEVSKQTMLDSGDFLQIRYSLSYARNAPSLSLPWKTRLSCYVIRPPSDYSSP